MARIEEHRCWVCKQMSSFVNGQCCNCRSIEIKKQKQELLSEWNDKNIEEKLDYLFETLILDKVGHHAPSPHDTF